MSDEISEIRSLLRSGDLAEIGGGRRIQQITRPTTASLVAAFAAIYLIWGSTYLAIRYA